MPVVLVERGEDLLISVAVPVASGKQDSTNTSDKYDTYRVTYDHLCYLLTKKQKSKTKRVYRLTKAAKIGKHAGLLARAMQTGKWSTGGEFDANRAFNRLIEQLSSAEPEDIDALSPRAIDALVFVYDRFPGDRRDRLVSVTGNLFAE